MPIHLRFLPLALAASLFLAAPASAAEYVPGEVIVKYEDGTTAEQVAITDGESVAETVDELEDNPKVAYAVPNYIAHAAQVAPNDPGASLQWNLFGEFGIGMTEAWALAEAAGAPAGRGAIVAVLDSGVAYERYKRFRRAPDLRASTFLRGYDFIERDRHPNDVYGHGTHVAGTIAQATNNGLGTTGIAHRARIMPLRVLDAGGSGDSASIAKAIRYAARRGADVINLSLEFPADVRAAEIPDVLSALRYAYRRRALIVAAAGNQSDRAVAFPARASQVIAVGATTRNGCEAYYSNVGRDLDISAPGGGSDAANEDNPWDAAHCRPDDNGPFVYQQTFKRERSIQSFGLPRGYEGTSMASPHVAAIAALVISTGKLGANPEPRAVRDHMQATARDLGVPGFDSRYGWGLVDAARALRCPAFTAC